MDVDPDMSPKAFPAAKSLFDEDVPFQDRHGRRHGSQQYDDDYDAATADEDKAGRKYKYADNYGDGDSDSFQSCHRYFDWKDEMKEKEEREKERERARTLSTESDSSSISSVLSKRSERPADIMATPRPHKVSARYLGLSKC